MSEKTIGIVGTRVRATEQLVDYMRDSCSKSGKDYNIFIISTDDITKLFEAKIRGGISIIILTPQLSSLYMHLKSSAKECEIPVGLIEVKNSIIALGEDAMLVAEKLMINEV
ncbi:hypothetical protein OGZ51_12540 [Lactococcus lactis]|uniref:Uncharacterized protein n=1 Tax=Lactococcus lactis TaxID=1358 RepID=A0A9X4NIZ4_9LACT|nr:hypothetical protein [Lactococcus lactis]MDG4984973.1 hypothetical protein [Lactococcus lactis]